MSLVCTHNLAECLKGANLLIDTCTIIDASNYDEVDHFLKDLSKNDCAFLSLPAVREEFTCSANNIKEYKQLSNYLDTLQILFLDNTEKRLVGDDNVVFNIALSRCKNIHPSYVDRMLLSIPYLFRNSAEKMYLMTSNRKDVPLEFFDMIGFATYADDIFHNIGVYEFNHDKFKIMTKDLRLS